TVVSMAAASAVLARSRSMAASPSEVVRVAVVGFNGRGGEHIGQFSKTDRGTEIAALVDVDENLWGKNAKAVEERQGKPPALYSDLRKMLEDKSIDAVSIATPNHWHTLAAIWAVQAGKDVYVEKPISHNVWEGRQLVKAA